MSARVVTLGSEKHRAIELLLPWYVNGSLETEEAAEVEAHLRECAGCQAELAWQRRLQSATAPTDAGRPVDEGWSALLSRLSGQDAEAAADAPAAAASIPAAPAPGRLLRRDHRRAARRDALRWFPWAFAAQFACMAGVAAFVVVALWNPAPYRTLGASTAASSANALVVFRAGATEAEMRRALRVDEATLVGGPTATDAYLVNVPPGRLSTALAHLRSDPAVARVESLEARSGQ